MGRGVAVLVLEGCHPGGSIRELQEAGRRFGNIGQHFLYLLAAGASSTFLSNISWNRLHPAMSCSMSLATVVPAQ